MTFDIQEKSLEGSSPIELYEFRVGSQNFFFTNGDTVVTVNSNTYNPVTISRSSLLMSTSERLKPISITMPSSEPFAQKYVNIVPGERTSCTIFRLHTTDATNETLLIFKGFVKSAAYDNDGTIAKIAVLPLEASAGRQIPPFVFSNLCNNVLYDSSCKVVQNNFRLQGTVTAIVGLVLTVPGASAQVDQFYRGGFISFGGTDFRLILDHVGDDLTIILPFNADVLLQAVDVFAGCDHTINTCESKFSNVINYKGFFAVPLRNPYTAGLG